VSGGSEDGPARWQALNHAVAVNQFLGYTNRVGMTNRKDHTPTPESNEVLYRFLEIKLAGLRGLRSLGTNIPFLRINSPSNQISPPPHSGRWMRTMSQWTAERFPLSHSS